MLRNPSSYCYQQPPERADFDAEVPTFCVFCGFSVDLTLYCMNTQLTMRAERLSDLGGEFSRNYEDELVEKNAEALE